MNNIKIYFGKKVRSLRQAQGYSQEDFARRCGIHRTYMGVIERGEKSVTIEIIEKIANTLKIKIKDLF